MKSFLTNKTGSAMIGLMVAIVIVAALMYGGSFFWESNTNTRMDANDTNINVKSPVDAIKVLDKAKDDIAEIQKNLDDRDQVIRDDSSKIIVTSVKVDDNVVSPVLVEGIGAATDNTLIIELRNSDHETMVKESIKIKAAKGESGPFKITLNFQFSNTKEGFVAVYEESLVYKSELNLVEIPVKFGDIDDWQTYRNEDNGFELQYPGEYYYVEENRETNDINIINKEEKEKETEYYEICVKNNGSCPPFVEYKSIIINIYNDKNNLSLDLWFKEEKWTPSNGKWCDVNGISGYCVLEGGYSDAETYFYTKTNNKIVEFTNVGWDEENQDEINTIKNYIVSTFKFIN